MGSRLSAAVGRRKNVLVMGIALVFATSGTAAAAGFMLGVSNNTTTTTTLRSTVNGAALQVTNANSNGTAVRGVGITVPTNRPPLTVNSGVKVRNLNVDKLDDLDSSQLQRATTATCAVGQKVRTIAPNGTVTCSADAIDGGDAQTVDGVDASEFLRTDRLSRFAGFNLAGETDPVAIIQAPTQEIRVNYLCPAAPDDPGTVTVTTQLSSSLFIDTGAATPVFVKGTSLSASTTPTDGITLSIYEWDTGVLTITLFVTPATRPLYGAVCEFQWSAVRG
jgi:hypothetical protein